MAPIVEAVSEHVLIYFLFLLSLFGSKLFSVVVVVGRERGGGKLTCFDLHLSLPVAVESAESRLAKA